MFYFTLCALIVAAFIVISFLSDGFSLTARARIIEVIWAVTLGSGFWLIMVGLYKGEGWFYFNKYLNPLGDGLDEPFWWTYFAINIVAYCIVRTRVMYSEMKVDLALERRSKR
jgi:hypothetical protein